MRYQSAHIRGLIDQVIERSFALRDSLHEKTLHKSGDTVILDGSKVRVAVDDFKSILSEIRRLR